MENYKVKVNNEAESKEVQELFFELGYKKSRNCRWLIDCIIDFFATDNDGLHCWDSEKNGEKRFNDLWHKELTIPQLRDLVVLKRNDVGDRNVVDPEYSDANLYLDSDSNLFVFHIPTQKWKESNLNGEEDVLQRLKPIEKEMKEYLDKDFVLRQVKQTGGDNHVPSEWIEVPKDAQYATEYFGIDFWKSLESDLFCKGVKDGWRKNEDQTLSDFLRVCSPVLVWQRHTQPEELPFIDNEPKCDNPLLIQVGGNHYKNLAIQPVEFAMKNNLDYCQANAIKYIVRHANKNGKQDLEKAKHYIDLLIQNYYSEDI